MNSLSRESRYESSLSLFSLRLQQLCPASRDEMLLLFLRLFHRFSVSRGVPFRPRVRDYRSFEVNIPNGVLKGRCAFRQAFEKNRYLVVRLKDNSVLVAKPDIHLKPPEFLKTLSDSTRPVSVEWKDDGSLANVAIHNLRAVYRSHRPEGESYYDKLPAIEDLHNRSPVWLARRLFPGPEQEGTVLRGELYHSDGAARVGGILNALPEKSIQIQRERGPVEFYCWDIAKFKGRDVSQVPYGQRRELYQAVIAGGPSVQQASPSRPRHARGR